MRDLTKSGRCAARALLTSCTSAVLALSFCYATPAAAAVTETVTVQNKYGFAVSTGSSFVPQLGGEKETFYVAGDLPTEQSEVGINYIGTASVGSFFFLHDNYCVGTCSTYSQTIITFELTNTGNAAVNLRFDSQITPGHLARIAGNAALNGSFQFDVVQTVNGENNNLYNANGGVNSDGIFLNTGNLAFNGLTTTTDPGGRWKVVDWSTTNLSIPLATLGVGETTRVSYIASYQVSSDAVCGDVLDCAGLQVVFGDPRNDGGVNNLPGGALQMNAGDAVYPVIGRNYDPAAIFARFVPIETPLPDDPAARPPTTYGPLFDPRAIGVPEPGTWAMMIGGLGMIGGVARRRRKIDQAFA